MTSIGITSRQTKQRCQIFVSRWNFFLIHVTMGRGLTDDCPHNEKSLQRKRSLHLSITRQVSMSSCAKSAKNVILKQSQQLVILRTYVTHEKSGRNQTTISAKTFILYGFSLMMKATTSGMTMAIGLSSITSLRYWTVCQCMKSYSYVAAHILSLPFI